MWTVPEVILAREAGLEVAALSVITNFAAGMSEERLSHEQTMRVAATAAETTGRLLRAFPRRRPEPALLGSGPRLGWTASGSHPGGRRFESG